MVASRFVLCVLSFAAVSCAADATSEPATLLLGIGDRRFEPLERGQHAQLYAGNQGGYHVWLCFRARGLEEDVRMQLDLTPAAPSEPSHWNLPISLEPAASEEADREPMLEFIGWRAQILQPECAVGSEVAISLQLTDARGVSAKATGSVIPDAPEEGFRKPCPSS